MLHRQGDRIKNRQKLEQGISRQGDSNKNMQELGLGSYLSLVPDLTTSEFGTRPGLVQKLGRQQNLPRLGSDTAIKDF